MTFWKKVSAPVLLAGLAAPALINCNGLPIPGADCPALKDGNFAALKLEGSAEVQGELKGFLEAVYNLDKLAVDMEAGLIASCGELGKAAGVDEASLKAEADGGEGAKKVCLAVADKIKATLSAAGDLSLSLELGEPRCEVNIEAMNSCLGECGAAIDPGEFSAACEGGEVSGTCEGECSGTCILEAGAECNGTCEGKCEGKCDGEDSSGSCAGTCEGTCSAACKVEGAASCSGSCSGGCSVDLKAPSCSGTFKPPSVDVDCHANCVAKTAADVKCTPPSLAISVEGEASAEIQGLIDGLQVALPKIVEIQIGMGKRLVDVGQTIVAKGKALPQVASSAGLQAIGCVAMAAEMAISASASISLSVEASASVSASAGG